MEIGIIADLKYNYACYGVDQKRHGCMIKAMTCKHIRAPIGVIGIKVNTGDD